MRLSKLVEETLNEIALGVRNSKEQSRSVMAIAPGTLQGNAVAEITYIEFDVSIVIDEKSGTNSSHEKGIDGEIKVLSIGGIGGKGTAKRDDNNSLSTQMSHRICFKVPVCMAADYLPK